MAKIPTVPRVDQYVATQSQQVFAYTFPILSSNQLTVQQNTVTLTLTTDYTVSGAGSETGGTITLVTGASDGDILTITGNTTIDIATSFTAGGDFSANTLNNEFARINTLLSEVATSLSQTAQMQVYNPFFSTLIPTPQGSKCLKINSSGTGFVMSQYDPDSAPAVTAHILELCEDALAACDSDVLLTHADVEATGANVVLTGEDVVSCIALVQEAEQARDDAETAQSLAEEAQAQAEAAQEAAEVAQGLAEDAQEAAEVAQGLAEDAQAAAEVAQGLAEVAQAAAEEAQRLAEVAQAAAEEAQRLAEVAQGLAEYAQGKAEEAQAAAEAAQDLAEAAQQASEAAQLASEAARDSSIEAQGLAEDAQDAAETAQALAEEARDDTETLKDEASDFADLSEQYSVTSYDYATLAQGAEAQSIQIRDDVEDFRDEAEAFRDEAEGFSDDASLSADTATTQAGLAAGSATAASDSADAAAASEQQAAYIAEHMDIHLNAINDNIIPDTPSAYTIGESTERFSEVWTDAAYVTNALLVNNMSPMLGSNRRAHYQYLTDDSGGTAQLTWTQRPINTEVDNYISGMSLTSNKIVFPKGTFYFSGRCSVFNTKWTSFRLYETATGTTFWTQNCGYTEASSEFPFSGYITTSYNNISVQIDQLSTNILGLTDAMGLDHGAGNCFLDIQIWQLT